MSGIPTYTSAPINPNANTTARKADGTTPQTIAGYGLPPSNPATTTASTSTLPTPPQPGSAAFLAPTSTSAAYIPSPPPAGTIPPPPTRSSDFDSPPPPQPGAVPVPAMTQQSRPSIPPPPKANELPRTASEYAPQPTPFYTSPAPVPLPLHQQQPSLTTPIRAQPPSSTTQHDLSHPPGYKQNTRASFEDKPLEPYRPFESSSNQSRGGLLGANDSGGEEKGIWDTAVSWAKTAGQKISNGEQEVWKAINRDK